MNNRQFALPLTLFLTDLVGAQDMSSAKDLTATIALNGQPCGQVVDVKRNAPSDYSATCQDGNRYHVFVSPQGRVIVQKQ